MNECMVLGMSGGGKVVVGALTVPKSATGATVDLGGLPQYIEIHNSKGSESNMGTSGNAYDFYPNAGQQRHVYLYASGYRAYITFTETGFYVSSNNIPVQFALYYLAVFV